MTTRDSKPSAFAMSAVATANCSSSPTAATSFASSVGRPAFRNPSPVGFATVVGSASEPPLGLEELVEERVDPPGRMARLRVRERLDPERGRPVRWRRAAGLPVRDRVGEVAPGAQVRDERLELGSARLRPDVPGDPLAHPRQVVRVAERRRPARQPVELAVGRRDRGERVGVADREAGRGAVRRRRDRHRRAPVAGRVEVVAERLLPPSVELRRRHEVARHRDPGTGIPALDLPPWRSPPGRRACRRRSAAGGSCRPRPTRSPRRSAGRRPRRRPRR